MNYIRQIKGFWSLHEEHSFTTTEIAVYFHLLEIANICQWKYQFKRNNSKIGADLGISYNTLKNARNKLQQAGLITFKTQNGSPNVLYTLSNFDEVTNEVTNEVDVEVTNEVGTRLARDNIKLKHKLKQKEEIPPNPQRGESEVSTAELSDFEKSVFEIWEKYTGKRNTFDKDLKNFCKKTENLKNIDFQTLKKKGAAAENKNIYFQSWLNDVLPKKTKKGAADFDLSFVDVAYIGIVKDFIEYRKQIKKPYKTVKGVEMFYAELLKLSANNLQKAKQLTEYAKGKEWQTVYQIKDNGTNQTAGTSGTGRNLESLAASIEQGIIRGANQ